MGLRLPPVIIHSSWDFPEQKPSSYWDILGHLHGHLSADIRPTQLELEQHQHRPISKPWQPWPEGWDLAHSHHSHHSHIISTICPWSFEHVWNMKLYICQGSCHINAIMHVHTWKFWHVLTAKLQLFWWGTAIQCGFEGLGSFVVHF